MVYSCFEQNGVVRVPTCIKFVRLVSDLPSVNAKSICKYETLSLRKVMYSNPEHGEFCLFALATVFAISPLAHRLRRNKLYNRGCTCASLSQIAGAPKLNAYWEDISVTIA